MRDRTIYESLPEGWSINKAATVHPRGYVWIHNNKSLFSPERRFALMRQSQNKSEK